MGKTLLKFQTITVVLFHSDRNLHGSIFGKISGSGIFKGLQAYHKFFHRFAIRFCQERVVSIPATQNQFDRKIFPF